MERIFCGARTEEKNGTDRRGGLAADSLRHELTRAGPVECAASECGGTISQSVTNSVELNLITIITRCYVLQVEYYSEQLTNGREEE